MGLEPSQPQSSNEQSSASASKPGIPIPKGTDASDSGVGRSYVAAPGAIALLLVLLIAMALAVYALVALWPPPAGSAPSPTKLFGISLPPNRDQQLFIIVGLSGALGGLIHSARSSYWYIGNRVLRRSWIAMYLTLPVIGSALAIVFCLILRGGLLVGGATGEQVNFFGFAAIAALIGLFSPEAAEKLQQVFSTLLAPAESGRDRSPRSSDAVIHGIQPKAGVVGTIITIYGANLTQSTAVLFHGARTQPVSVSDVAVTARVPEGTSTGPVCLVLGDRVLPAPGLFQVQSP
jgi:IPT/TIG domain